MVAVFEDITYCTAQEKPLPESGGGLFYARGISGTGGAV